MTLSEYSLRSRHTIYALTIAAIVFGVMAYLSLPIQLFPDTAPPLVNVITPYPGASAADVADLLSDPLESECASLEGVSRITSTSQDGLSLVTIEFRYNVSVDLAAVDVQNAIDRVRGKLPREIGEPQVLKFSTSDRPVLTMGLVGDDLAAVRRLADDVFAPELQRVKGVAVVDVFGGSKPEVTVSVNRMSLEAQGLSLGQVVTAIRSHNVSLPAGQIRSAGRQYSFRVDQRSRMLSDLRDIPLLTHDGQLLRVGNVAMIDEGKGEDLSRYRVNGRPAIAMQILKQDDFNTVEVVRRARDRFADFARDYPRVEFVMAEESASFTEQVVSNMLDSVWQALLLAAIVIFLFLGSFRRGLVVIVSMPLSFLLTFAGMKLFGIQVDLVTLTAIILAVGMVIDASVVVLENITRRYAEESLTPDDAARLGASEVQLAVIAGNATTLIVLIPLLFLYGFIGKTFGPLAATLIIAFVSSLFVALTVVPIMTALVSRPQGRLDELAVRITRPWTRAMDGTRRLYVLLLQKSLQRRWVVFTTAIVLLLFGIVILRFQGMELLPKMDSGGGFITVETTPGSSLDQTEAVMQEVEEVVLREEAVQRISDQIGFEPGMHTFGGGGVQGPTQGYIAITYSPRTERGESIWQIQDRLRDRLHRLPGIQNLVVRESGGTAKATTASSIVVNVMGDDPLILDALGEVALSTVGAVDGIVNPYRLWRTDQRNTTLAIRARRAAQLGWSPGSIATNLVASLDGVNAGILRGAGGDDTPIRVRYAERFRDDRRKALAVNTPTSAEGRILPLGIVMEEHDQEVQGLITRENLQPTLQILALHQGRPLSFVAADVREAISDLEVPQGYSINLEGEEKDMAESRAELIVALAIAAIGVYLLLVAQFRSFLHPFTVFMAVPLSLIGVSVTLWMAGKPVSMPVLIGLILLVGIVVNNSIILVDFIRIRRTEGMARHDAIIAAVETRFRPIMMTSMSTIVGMIPLALEWALGAERFSPLAVAVIGGMTASTFLTMLVIPILYDGLEDWQSSVRRLFGQWRNGTTVR